MSHLPFSRLSTEAGGNVYHDVSLTRFNLQPGARVVIEGEDLDGHPVRMVFHSLRNDASNGVGVADVVSHLDPYGEAKGFSPEATYRLVIDAELEPSPRSGEEYHLQINPPRLQITKRDAANEPHIVRDYTHQATVKRVKASKTHTCAECQFEIHRDSEYVQVTDHAKVVRRIGGNRPVYDVRKYHIYHAPRELRPAVDLVMGRA